MFLFMNSSFQIPISMNCFSLLINILLISFPLFFFLKEPDLNKCLISIIPLNSRNNFIKLM